MRLRKKIGMFFIFSCIIPVIIILMYISNQNIQNIRELNRKEIEKTVDLVGMVANHEIEKGSISLEYLKTSVMENKFGSYKIKKTLYDLYSESSNFRKIFFIDEKTGQIESYPSSTEDMKLKEASWYKNSRRTKSQVSLPYVDEKTGKLFITLTKSVRLSNILLGVVGVEVELTNSLKNIEDGNSFVSLLLLEKTSKQVVYPTDKTLSEGLTEDILKGDIYSEISMVKSYKDKKLGVVDYYTQDLKDTSLVLVGKVNISKDKPLYSKSKVVIYASIAIVVLLCFFSVVILNIIVVEPLGRIKDKIRQGAMGNYGIRIFVDSDDEIGELCSEFNYLMKKINRKMKKMDEGTRLGLTKEDVEADIELDDAVDALSSFENLEDLEENSISIDIDEDEEFKQKQKELVHRTFDEWRSEYYKTIEAKKKKVNEQAEKYQVKNEIE